MNIDLSIFDNFIDVEQVNHFNLTRIKHIVNKILPSCIMYGYYTNSTIFEQRKNNEKKYIYKKLNKIYNKYYTNLTKNIIKILINGNILKYYFHIGVNKFKLNKEFFIKWYIKKIDDIAIIYKYIKNEEIELDLKYLIIDIIEKDSIYDIYDQIEPILFQNTLSHLIYYKLYYLIV